MCSYEAANRLMENKSLLSHNLKAFIPLYRILRTGIIRDVSQDISVDVLRDLISSPLKILDIHRLNRRSKVDNEFKYLPSRTVCIKFLGQSLPQYIYLYNCRHLVYPVISKARICFVCFRVAM